MQKHAPAVFSYGTLQITEVMAAVTGRHFQSSPARLDHHARYALQGQCYPGLRQQFGCTTHGRLYRGLDADALRLLDGFEDACYQRQELTVIGADQRAARAQVYVVPPAHYHHLSAEPWDLEQFRQRHLAVFLEQCRHYHRQALAGSGLE